VLIAAPVAAADDPFEIVRFRDEGRTVLAEIVDLNGDGRKDLLQGIMRGIPPNQKRVIQVRFQGEDGVLPAQPSFEIPCPPHAAAYDLGDLRDTPGVELLLLRGQDLMIMSLASPDAPSWTLSIPDGTSAGAAEDERGLEQLVMIHEQFADDPWILVPLFGRMIALSAEGELLATMTVPPRANFYIPPAQGFYFGESDIQLFFDAPRVSIGDIDGDGHADLAAANRHEIRVFLQRDGTFTQEPTRVIALGRVTEKDHIRGSGGVTAEGSDFDGDGRMDLLVSHVAGSFRDAHTTTTAYLNRDGDWDWSEPVGVFKSEGALAGDLLVDLDGDGRPELLRTEVPMSVLEMVELLVTGSVDAKVSVHPYRDGRFSRRPTARIKLGIAHGRKRRRAARSDAGRRGRRAADPAGWAEVAVRKDGREPGSRHVGRAAQRRPRRRRAERLPDLQPAGSGRRAEAPAQPGNPTRLPSAAALEAVTSTGAFACPMV
jgi:hypothetical protein